MPESNPSPLHWKPVPAPERITLNGRTVTLEPLSAESHTASLWQAVRGHDGIWDWLADGPYSAESELREALSQKQTGTAAVFFAVVPSESRFPEAAGAFTPVKESESAPAAAAIPEGAGAFMPLKERENARPSGPGTSTAAQAAGYASYMRIDPTHGVVEIGNILMSPSLQRTTAATEAIYLMARHVFEDLGYRRYEWKCNALNEPSRRAALRYGFTYEGIFRQHMVIKGQNRNTAWFSMLDSEWPARKAAFEAWLDPANFDADGRQRRPLSALFLPTDRSIT